MKIFYLILSQNKITFRIIIKCNNIFETNILYTGYPTKLNNNRNSRTWGVWQAPPGMEILSGWGSSAKVPCVGRRGDMDIFWKYTMWGNINCSIWTQSCIIIDEKVTKKQSWHSLQDQGSAAISLAISKGYHVSDIIWYLYLYILSIYLYLSYIYISTTRVYLDPTLLFPDCDDPGWLLR